MKKMFFLFTAVLFYFLFSFNSLLPQVAINNTGSLPHTSAILDVQSTSKGFLIPSMTQAQRNAISAPLATGLLIFQTDNSPGFYFYSGSGWTLLGGTGGAITGSGTNGYLTFWNGTNSISGNPCLQWSPADSILRITGRIYQSGLGFSTFFGHLAGRIDDGTSNYNSGFGYQSLYSNTGGVYNSAFGLQSLYNSSTGSDNSAFGSLTLFTNTTGNSNSAFGDAALYYNTTGNDNSAFGYSALVYNTTGESNSAFGDYAGGFITGNNPNQTSIRSVYLGANTKAFADGDTNEIVIGYSAIGVGSNSVVLGNINITKTILRGTVGLGTPSPNSSSIFDMTSTSKGLLIPRMTQSQRDAISSPATGLLIYQTNNTPGFYYYSGSAWTSVSSGGTVSGSGTNSYVTFWNGTNSVTGESNLFWDATNNRLGINTSSPNAPLQVNGRVFQDGLGWSTFFGYYAGNSDDGSSNYNSAFGHSSLFSNTTGFSNSAFGYQSLHSNITGVSNSAFGYYSLSSNTTGNYNTAVGNGSLFTSTASWNSAFGHQSLLNNTTGNENSAFGYQSLSNNTTGYSNVAFGFNAGRSIASGSSNQTGIRSVYLGYDTRAYANGDTNEIVIGYSAIGVGSNSVVLGNSSITKTILRGTVGLGTENPNSSSIFDMTSTSKGILIPRMTQTQRDAISSPATGLLIYQTNNTPGFYYYSGSAWSSVSSGGTVSGSGSNGYVTFWNGTNSVTGSSGLKWQGDTLLTINGRVDQTGLGFCTFFGYLAGISDDGSNNYNSAFGYSSLNFNTTGNSNSAFGYSSLHFNTTGFSNSAFGTTSLYNTTGNSNSAFGYRSLYFNTTGNGNCAFGITSLEGNTTGNGNCAFGTSSLYHNTTGYSNVAFGSSAGYYTSIGSFNQTSITSVYLGNDTRANASRDTNEIVIGYNAYGQGSNSVVLGNSSITKTVLRGNTGIGITSPSTTLDVNGNARFRAVSSGTYNSALNLTSDGTLTTSTSDARMKTNIENLNNSLDKISKLKGVSFNWKTEPDGKKHLGFIAQDMEEVIPELVFTNPVDGYKGINYSEITAVLTEGIKEQQSQINELKSENTELKNRLNEIERKLEGKNILAKSDGFSSNGIFWIFLSVCAVGSTLFGIKKIFKSK